jgi:hypothetical protein
VSDLPHDLCAFFPQVSDSYRVLRSITVIGRRYRYEMPQRNAQGVTFTLYLYVTGRKALAMQPRTRKRFRSEAQVPLALPTNCGHRGGYVDVIDEMKEIVDLVKKIGDIELTARL